MGNPITTRFAPSPTGLLHVGGLRTALYAFLLAKQSGGTFLLRIEDTDRTRFVEGAEENIKESLLAFGLEWSGEVLHQSERLPVYNKIADQLVTNGQAYPCFCTAERLETVRLEQQANKRPTRYDGTCRELVPEIATQRITTGETHVIRLKMPTEGTTRFTDAIRGEVEFSNALIDDQVLIKSDGFPTYHLASVVDDNESNISHVIRGEEWISSTPKHLQLYAALGWQPPVFAHLPLLLNTDRSKLSKRQGDVAVKDYLEKGYLPEALLNFVLLLGWNPGTDHEIFSLNEMLTEFKLERIHKAGAVFDIQKLDWLNSQYIRKTPLDRLVEYSKLYYEKAGIKVEPDKLKHMIAVEQERLKTLAEIVPATAFYFALPEYDGLILRWKQNTNEATAAALQFSRSHLEKINETDWDAGKLEQLLIEEIKGAGKSNGDMLWPLRVALCGQKASPGPFAIAGILGKPETLRRIDLAIQKTSS